MVAWSSITEAQATIVAALLTLAGALLGVVLGWWLFSTKVKTLTDALDSAQDRLHAHEADVDRKLTKIEGKFENLVAQSAKIPEAFAVINDQLAAVIQVVRQVEGDVSDQREQVEAASENTAWFAVRNAWSRIRDRLDQIASNPKIDGRRRAKYARLDRRNYGWLIDSLQEDGNLKSVSEYNEALDLWHQYRNGKKTPSNATVKAMQALADKLAPTEPGA